MRTSLALVALVGGAAALPAWYVEANHMAMWEAFKVDHGKVYSSSVEEATRRAVFKDNMLRAAGLESRNPRARFGANQFADLTPAEFKATHHNLKFPAANATRGAVKVYGMEEARRLAAAPKDWRPTAVTHVKNQGACGSCWSFSVVGAVEGQNALHGTKKLTPLSEQELVSCDMIDAGCNGGLMDRAFDWLVNSQAGNIVTEAAYPYTSGQGEQGLCKLDKSMPVGATVTGHRDLPHDEEQMAAWVAENGPISIGVDATSWMHYQGGVLDRCSGFSLDHGVLAVGFGADFWIIKNSWGTSWGEGGYIRVSRGSNQCLINQAPAYPLVATGPAPTVPPTPAPPAPPATKTYTRRICQSAGCASMCTELHGATCTKVPGGGSVVVDSCSAAGLVTKFYPLSDNCTGMASDPLKEPVGQCAEAAQGTWEEITCA